ncbi:hypothetical protein KUCAC02_025784, partial [Chaenocephalus aceratus]
LAVPLVTVRGALQNKGLAVESCLDGKREKAAEPDGQNQRDALISQSFTRNGLVQRGWG